MAYMKFKQFPNCQPSDLYNNLDQNFVITTESYWLFAHSIMTAEQRADLAAHDLNNSGNYLVRLDD